MRHLSLLFTLFLFYFFFSPSISLHAQKIDWLGSQQMGGAGKDRGDALARDREGNLIVGGAYVGAATFAGQPLLGRGATDAYMAKFSKGGALQWIKSFGGTEPTSSVRVMGLDADSAGNIYAAGSFLGTVTIMGITLTSERSDIFLAKFAPDGTMRWLRRAGDRPGWREYPGGGVAGDVAVDSKGNAYVTGTIDDSVYFETTLAYGDFQDAFLAKYNTDGALQWVRTAGGMLPDNAQEVCVDPAGNPIICGNFVDTMRVGGFPLASYGWEDIFIAKYDPSGTPLWARSGGSFDTDLTFGLACDALGNIYANGIYTFPMAFGSVTLPVNGLLDMFLVKYNSSGVFQWAQRTSGFGHEAPGAIAADAAGNTYSVGGYFGHAVFGTGGEGTVQNQESGDIFIAKYNTDGAFQWVRSATGAKSDTGSTANAIVLAGENEFYISGLFYGEMAFGSLLLKTRGSSDAYLAHLGDPGSFPSVSGMVYGDVNGDGAYDATEPGLRGRMIEVTPGPIYATTDTNGLYRLYLNPGTYTLAQVLEDYWRHTAPAAPGTYTVQVDSTDTAAGRNFGTQPIPGIQDLAVTVTNIWPARPGFEQYYLITYRNRGTVGMDGSVSFEYDPQLTYDIAEPPPATHTGNRLQWNFTNLLPGESRDIIVNMALSPNVGLGVTLACYATVEPLSADTTKGDNRDTLTQVTQGSYDPNDITVLPRDEEGGSIIYPNDHLTYIIRFQNTGTDTAFTVVVTDTLDAGHDPATFEMVSASHDYTYEISGQGVITWRFENILLPHAGRDEKGSHGMIRYQIRPKKGLENGTLIDNTAAIYFDFNEPVITNTVTSMIAGVSGVQETPRALSQGAYLFPSPLVTSALLRVEGEYRGPYTVTLHDEGGRVLRTIGHSGNNAIRIDREDLPRGACFYTVSAGGATVARGKFMVE